MKLGQQRQKVDPHPHGDEEKPQQDILKWADIGLDLMTILGLTQHHAGQEGAQGEGEPGLMGQPGSGQGYQEYGEGEEFG